MPQAAGRLSLSTHKGMEFPAAFNKSLIYQAENLNFTFLRRGDREDMLNFHVQS
ncbi:hypothetical protein H6G35_27105 [Aulosira sp. FACHB-113]|nr:hypothetical protein [Aulosira sp. FACHB-113]